MKRKSNKIIITTDFKLAPKQATNAKQWVEGLNLDEVRKEIIYRTKWVK